jgi:type IV secretion system protein TrbL
VADPTGAGTRVLALDINPLHWLGSAAVGAATDTWKAAMIGLWTAGVWLLQLAFKLIDAFTTPDVSATGPLAAVLPTTLWLGLFVVSITLAMQLAVAVVRRDGKSLGRIVIGICQFGVVWIGYLAVAGLLIAAASGLTTGLLSSMLHIPSWSAYAGSNTWPRQLDDTAAASVLGLSALFLLIPASFAYVLIMLVREASLILLLATAPIAAAGLVNDTTKMWFWKTLRWFLASLLIAPAAALILGVGTSLSNGVISGAGTDTVAAAGTAVVGCVLVMIGALCPMTLFKLLAFVDPGTGSGAAMRQSMSDAGGLGGLLGGGKNASSSAGSGAATATSGGGQSQGEASAQAQSASRMSKMLGPIGTGIGMATSMATRAADLTSDILGQAGVGDPGYSMSFADNASRNRPSASSSNSGGSGWGGSDTPPTGGGQAGPGDSGNGGGAPLPTSPPTPPMTPVPVGPGAGGPGAGAGAAGAGAGVSEAAVVAL